MKTPKVFVQLWGFTSFPPKDILHDRNSDGILKQPVKVKYRISRNTRQFFGSNIVFYISLDMIQCFLDRFFDHVLFPPLAFSRSYT